MEPILLSWTRLFKINFVELKKVSDLGRILLGDLGIYLQEYLQMLTFVSLDTVA